MTRSLTTEPRGLRPLALLTALLRHHRDSSRRPGHLLRLAAVVLAITGIVILFGTQPKIAPQSQVSPVVRRRIRRLRDVRPVLAIAAALVASIFYLAQPVFTPAQAAPTLLWAGDAEEASLSDWTSSGGGIFNTGTGNASASTDFARSGSYSAKMSITNASGASQAVRLFRWAESRTNPEAYYSAWYYFPQDYSGMNWWNVFQFKSKLSDTVNDPTFTLNVGNRSGQMFFYLYDHLNGNINRGWSSTAIPVGRWFHLEAFYKQAADNTGRVTFWQDGVQILDLSGVSTRRSGDEIHWSLTNYTDNISPSSATIYVDDAAISTARLSEASSPTATAKPTSPAPTASTPPITGGTNYYVDSSLGSDSNAGTSDSSPWKSLSAVQSHGFSPGDTINFKRGSSWSGGLTITTSGAAGKPITFKAYGSGARPVITNPGVKYGAAIRLEGDYLVVQDFLTRDAHRAGIMVAAGANNNVVQDNEITSAGTGVYLEGQLNLATRNYAHDLTMITNTADRGDDDYGAVGIWVAAPNNEVSYNRIENARAASYDYGYDGGAVELYGSIENVHIHHNYSKRSNGFLEAGGGSAKNILLDYNVSDNDYSAMTMLHLTGTFSAAIDNFRVENNTIVKPTREWRILDFGGDPSPSTFLFRNNVVYSATAVSNKSSFTHSNNLYSLLDGASLGFSLAGGEKLADPRFLDSSTGDYHLQYNSPAIDSGLDLGYSLDFDGASVPSGATPDIGAFEFASTGAVPPTAVSQPNTPPTSNHRHPCAAIGNSNVYATARRTGHPDLSSLHGQPDGGARHADRGPTHAYFNIRVSHTNTSPAHGYPHRSAHNPDA